MPTIKNLSQTGRILGILALATAAFLPATAGAQTCADPVAADFKVDTLAYNTTGDLYENTSNNGGESNAYGVVQIAMAPDGKVFVAKMCSGQIRIYDPASGLKAATTLVGRVPTHCDNEDGLLGIVLAPDFATSKWIYVFATDSAYKTTPANADTGKAHSLWRYTYDATAAAGQQLKNPKRILRVQRMIDSRAYHAAGGIDIAADGTMVIGTGDDTSPHDGECPLTNNFAPIMWNDRGCDAQKSSSNTASLRGKLLRIKPITFQDDQTPAMGEGTTYTIPAGNLWEKIDKPAFNPNWNPAVDNISKVRKEIYTFGHRNPYHPRIDSKSGWIFTGEVGLDATAPNASKGPEGKDEWNLATEAGFYGHPYCAGNNLPWHKVTMTGTTPAWIADTSFNCAAIQNVSPNNYGITNLPPAKPAVLSYSNVNNNGDDSYRLGFTSGETAIGGPMYRYDPSLVSASKFPPQYEGRIFFFDWSVTNKTSFRILRVNPNGTLDTGVAATPAFPGTTGLPNGAYIDMRFGADGAMYVLRNNTGGSNYTGFNNAALLRVRYVGAIDNSCYTPFNATVGPAGINGSDRPTLRRNVAPALVNGIVNLPLGYKSVELYNLSGQKVWVYRRASADQQEAVTVPVNLTNGILHAKLIP